MIELWGIRFFPDGIEKHLVKSARSNGTIEQIHSLCAELPTDDYDRFIIIDEDGRWYPLDLGKPLRTRA